jgi:dTDP-glucose pyrophosphorylase
MAGLGSRFSNAGYKDPKPFIEALGKTLIETVLNNLDVKDAHFILIARGEHLENYQTVLKGIRDRYNVTVLTLDHLTEGAAITVLKAHSLINNEQPLLIANSDQFVEFDVAAYLKDCDDRNLDGSILTFTDEKRDPKWSFARLNSEGFVSEVKEKEAISDKATVGIYYFSHGKDFIAGAIDMIVANDRVNNEFYTCPVYNYLISKNKKIGIFNIGPNKMHGLGTPDDLNEYIRKFS